ncbi:MAG: hypothetical protein COV35_09225 [Alphaproteobacteria bacterium CG11_big_fil_rev_8_21_14_0_20_39_49]|nr:MAG: hypothetical protein COV35_09225 [Alphaproteobacteria bacterium CG11_big_fil_rev_8_21_14_0_20_39_49]
MTYKSRKTQKGFTLVELAIVLVIIGLIVSGVLVGQDLIKAAELRATVRQHQEFQVAVNTFLGKYNGIPGDTDSDKFGLCDGDGPNPTNCNVVNAGTATTGCDGEANLGDGNGLIGDNNGGAVTMHNGEISCFWAQLTTPGKELIRGVFDGFTSTTGTGPINDGVGSNMPAMRTTGFGWSVFNDGTNNYFITGVIGSHDTDAYHTGEPFVPLDAYDIDSKIDDGIPSAGNVVAVNGQTAGTPALQTGADFTNAGVLATACQNTTPNPDEYQFTATAPLCNLMIKMETF